MYQRTLRAIGVLALSLFVCATLYADVVCRASKIQGCDSQYASAIGLLGESTTQKLSEMKVYVTVAKEDGTRFIYAHSNYITSGAIFPTKIATAQVRDLELITQNLVDSDETLSQTARRLISKAHQTTIKYYLDQDLVLPSGKFDLDLADARNIYVKFADLPTPLHAVRLELERGPPYIAELRPSLYVPVNQTIRPNSIITRLQARKFDKQKFVLIALTTNTDTIKAIRESSLAACTEFLPEKPTEQWLESVFKQNPQRTVAVLGHVEDAKHVVKDAKGNILLATSIPRVEQFAATNRCTLVDFGCMSADSAELGVVSTFKTLDAIESMKRGVEAPDMASFLEKSSSPKVKMLVSEPVKAQPTEKTTVQVLSEEGGRTTQVATISVSFNDGLAGTEPSPSDSRLAVALVNEGQ
jgi:hypothetical protein